MVALVFWQQKGSTTSTLFVTVAWENQCYMDKNCFQLVRMPMPSSLLLSALVSCSALLRKLYNNVELLLQATMPDPAPTSTGEPGVSAQLLAWALNPFFLKLLSKQEDKRTTLQLFLLQEVWASAEEACQLNLWKCHIWMKMEWSFLVNIQFLPTA